MTTRQPEALRLANVCSNLTRYSMDAHLIAAKLLTQQARITDLEAQLEAIGAGGVSGPLIGQPQAMPDLSQLTERGAVAWAGVDAQALREGRWYMVTHDGVATLCEDLRDAEKEAKDADMAWPHSGPHRAVQLVEASTAGFTAADMATAAAQGFRDGAASLSASAGSEPVAYAVFAENGNIRVWATEPQHVKRIAAEQGLKLVKLYTHPSPPEGMAGWISVMERLPEWAARDDTPCFINGKEVPPTLTSETVVVALKGGGVRTDKLTTIEGKSDGWWHTYGERVVAWQKTPALPASEAKEL